MDGIGRHPEQGASPRRAFARRAGNRAVGALLAATALVGAAPAETLKIHGDATTGGAIQLELTGVPGAPALLFLSVGFQDPAIPTVAGPFRLDLSSVWLLVPFGSVPAGGAIVLPTTLPVGPSLLGVKLHMQAAAPDLTNAATLAVHAPAGSLFAASPAPSDRFGSGLVAADWNADGYEDVAVAAVNGNGGAGRVTLFHGPALAAGPVIDDPTPQAGGAFGGALAAGDGNGDGLPDLLVGAFGAGAFVADSSGEVWWIDAGTGAVIQHLTSPFPAPGEGFGTDVALLDHDGDGMLDIAIGAPGATVNGLPLAGRVYVYTHAGVPHVLLTEPQPEALSIFGGVLAAGDVDLDGRDDLLVGAPAASVAGISRAGEAFLFSSAAQLAATYAPPTPTFAGAFGCRVRVGAVAGGPKRDVIIGTPGGAGSSAGNPLGIPNVGEVEVYVDGDPSALLLLDDPTPEFFQHFGMDASVADVNGDGVGDLVCGAFLADSPGAADAGDVSVFFGPSLALRIDVTAPTPAAFAQFGVFAIGADVDGDGRAELVVGSPLESVAGAADAGRVYVIDLE